MSTSVVENLKRQFKDKEFRDAFVEESMTTKLALQIRALREQRGWSQAVLAEKSAMKQARISEVEDPNYGRISVTTLRRLASAFDTALDVAFITFGDALEIAARRDEQKLFVASFAEDSFFQEHAVECGLSSDSEKGEVGQQNEPKQYDVIQSIFASVLNSPIDLQVCTSEPKVFEAGHQLRSATLVLQQTPSSKTGLPDQGSTGFLQNTFEPNRQICHA